MKKKKRRCEKMKINGVKKEIHNYIMKFLCEKKTNEKAKFKMYQEILQKIKEIQKLKNEVTRSDFQGICQILNMEYGIDDDFLLSHF
jgi:hypothetical protein